MILAADEGDLIGRDGALPWHFPDDLRRFRTLTTGHVLVAGRRTFDSVVTRLGHPLPGRYTVVVSRHPGAAPRSVFVPDPAQALDVAQDIATFAGRDEVFIMGGAQVYEALLPRADRIQLTRVLGRYDGDVRMPAGWLDGFTRTSVEPHAEFRFETYEPVPPQ